MPTKRRIAGRSLIVVVVTVSLSALAFASCQAPEAFYPDDGGRITGAAGRPVTGAAGTTGPAPTGAAGQIASGRGGATGVAGSPGHGGATVVPGRGGATGNLGRGGTTGAVDAGVPGRGGATGNLGRGGATGAVDAGIPGRGGATGGLGRGGSTGGLGRGGSAGATRDGGIDARDAGTVRDAGNPTDARTDGATGTGPCAGLCDMPAVVRAGTASGDLGTDATCDEVTGNVTHIVCGNFVTPRTMKVNNVTVSCAGSGVMLPAARNGGYCMQASAGQYSYAYFETY